MDRLAYIGLLSEGKGGEDGLLLRERKHHRRVHQTPEVPQRIDIDFFDCVSAALEGITAFIDSAEQSWYKFEKTHDILILHRIK